MLLHDLQSLQDERPVTEGCYKNYRRSIQSFGTFLRRPAKRSDLTERLVNAWLSSIAGDRSPATIRTYKNGITIIWNWLAEQGLATPYNPRRLRRISNDIEPPQPFSLAQLELLLAAARLIKSPCRYGTATEMLTAFILVAYESGLRPSDLRRLRPTDLTTPDVTIRQNKTGKSHSFRLSPVAMAAIQPLIAAGNETVFPATKYELDRWNKRLMKFAKKLGLKRRSRQGLGTIRKTHATEICRHHGLEVAARSLGHVTGTRMARDHYVAPSAIEATPLPPPINF